MGGSGQQNFSVFIGNIVPQAPANLKAVGNYNSIDLTWNADGGSLNDVNNRYPALAYNVYRDGAPIAGGLTDNSYSDMGVENNVTYTYAVSATYSDGEESDTSDSIEVTPQAQTVHEEYHDDGTAEDGFNAGSGNFTAVKYIALSEGETVVRFKWYQQGDGGAFYLKMYNDDNGMPGDEFFSQVMAGGLVDGWNINDLSGEALVVSGDFWIGAKEFSSSKPFVYFLT